MVKESKQSLKLYDGEKIQKQEIAQITRTLTFILIVWHDMGTKNRFARSGMCSGISSPRWSTYPSASSASGSTCWDPRRVDKDLKFPLRLRKLLKEDLRRMIDRGRRQFRGLKYLSTLRPHPSLSSKISGMSINQRIQKGEFSVPQYLTGGEGGRGAEGSEGEEGAKDQG